MTQEEILALAKELVHDEEFSEKLAQVCSRQFRENTKGAKDKIAGRVKTKLEEKFALYRRQRELEIEEELDTWFNSHMKRQIEKSKAGIIERLSTQVERWLDNRLDSRLDSSFHTATKAVVESLIREKFADVRLSFTVGDLFRERY